MRVAFHSYKGGVGRTKVMVGIGALLATMGRKVGMIDFDLDASSLATMFKTDGKKFGELELLHILCGNNAHLACDAMISIDKLVEKRFNQTLGDGVLKYIPTVSDPRLSDEIQFDDDPKRMFVDAVFDSVEKAHGLEILLIDLKPGFSPSSSVVLPFVDKAVVATRLDNQNIAGLATTVPTLVRQKLSPVLVVNMVPRAEKVKKLVDARLRMLEEAVSHQVAAVIDYDADLIFDDDFSCAADSRSQFCQTLHSIINHLGIPEE